MALLKKLWLGSRGGSAAQPVVNRRRTERLALSFNLDVLLLDCAGDPAVRVKMQNLAMGGLGFLSRRRFDVGERFVVNLCFANQGGRQMLCRTILCKAAADGWHRIGAKFVDAVARNPEVSTIPLRWRRNDGPGGAH